METCNTAGFTEKNMFWCEQTQISVVLIHYQLLKSRLPGWCTWKGLKHFGEDSSFWYWKMWLEIRRWSESSFSSQFANTLFKLSTGWPWFWDPYFSAKFVALILAPSLPECGAQIGSEGNGWPNNSRTAKCAGQGHNGYGEHNTKTTEKGRKMMLCVRAATRRKFLN